MTLRRLSGVGLLAVTIGMLTTCSDDSITRPRDERLVTSSPVSYLLLGPIDGLTTTWHPAPLDFAVPVGSTLRIRCLASPGASVVWTGVAESTRDSLGSTAMCPVSAAIAHEISVEIVTPVEGGKDQDRPHDRGVAAVNTSRYTCRVLGVTFDLLQIRIVDVSVSAQPVAMSEYATNWERLKLYASASVATVHQVNPKSFISSIATPLTLRAEVHPPVFAPLVEWRIGGGATLLGDAPVHVFDDVGSHEVEVGPVGRSVTLVLDTYRVTSAEPDEAYSLLPEGRPITFRAKTEPPGFEKYITWLTATLHGTATPATGHGASFTAKFEGITGADGSRWAGVRADHTKFSAPEGVGCNISTAQALALATKSLLGISDSAVVYLSCSPVPPGTTLSEQNPLGLGTVLQVPLVPANGAYYTVFIDEEPNFRWSHEARYAWVDYSVAGIQGYQVVSADWAPVLDVPGQASGPFFQLASVNAGGTAFKIGMRGGKGYVHDISHKANAQGITGSSGTTRCKRKYLVFDAGDVDDGWSDGGADEFSDDADQIQAWLEAAGFDEGMRVSQYWENDHPCIRKVPPKGYGGGLGDLIKACGAWFECPPDSSCCHEFFLYLSGHGGPTLVQIANPDGGGGENGYALFEQDLFTWLNAFPPCVKIIVVIDACFSGGAVSALDDLCATRGGCGVTIVTTTDVESSGNLGENVIDSGTTDFMQGALFDFDGDGKLGDFYDRWTMLEIQNFWNSPQRFMCQGQNRMCSTD